MGDASHGVGFIVSACSARARATRLRVCVCVCVCVCVLSVHISMMNYDVPERRRRDIEKSS